MISNIIPNAVVVIIPIKYEPLTFLINNKDNWKLEDGEIKFLEEDLFHQYIGMIEKLKNSN